MGMLAHRHTTWAYKTYWDIVIDVKSNTCDFPTLTG